MAKANPVSSDPAVPADVANTPPATGTTDVAAAADNGDGTVDAQAAAEAGQKARESKDAAGKKGATIGSGVVPTGGVVRQLEDGAETDRRTGAAADKSLAGENLPVLRNNEPDPRQGVTTGDLTNPGIVDGADTQEVTFLVGYHLYNTGESATFSAQEAQRLIELGVAE